MINNIDFLGQHYFNITLENVSSRIERLGYD